MADLPGVQGYFIVLEGTDGSGLSTQAPLLRDALLHAGRAAYVTKEPSEGPAGAIIRLALTRRLGYAPFSSHTADEGPAAAAWEPLGDDVLALLYAADRLDHLRQVITPRLAHGVDVVCDRYRLSSLAYQALTADPDWVAALNSKARPPDLTVFLDVAPEVSRERMARRQGGVELYEQDRTIRRIRENYLRLIAAGRAAGENIAVVDGEGPIDAVAARVWAACRAALPGLA